jgi:predicted nucleic acid-binding Zn ribbon protein
MQNPKQFLETGHWKLKTENCYCLKRPALYRKIDPMNKKILHETTFVLFSIFALTYIGSVLLQASGLEQVIVTQISKYAELPSIFLGLLCVGSSVTEKLSPARKLAITLIWLLAAALFVGFVVLKYGAYFSQVLASF